HGDFKSRLLSGQATESSHRATYLLTSFTALSVLSAAFLAPFSTSRLASFAESAALSMAFSVSLRSSQPTIATPLRVSEAINNACNVFLIRTPNFLKYSHESLRKNHAASPASAI